MILANRYDRSPRLMGHRMQFDQLKRREFITLVGGAATWPLTARAQQPDRMRRIGVLMAFAESDREGQALVAAFREELKKFGWAEGRNIRIDFAGRRPTDEVMQRFARELVALQPDLPTIGPAQAASCRAGQGRSADLRCVSPHGADRRFAEGGVRPFRSRLSPPSFCTERSSVSILAPELLLRLDHGSRRPAPERPRLLRNRAMHLTQVLSTG